jgi:hypothetical protein
MVPVLEGGSTTGINYHYHSIVEVPPHLTHDDVIEILNSSWRSLDGVGRQNDWQASSGSGWLAYMLKHCGKESYRDCLDLRSLWLNLHTLDAEASLLRETTTILEQRAP